MKSLKYQAHCNMMVGQGAWYQMRDFWGVKVDSGAEVLTWLYYQLWAAIWEAHRHVRNHGKAMD